MKKDQRKIKKIKQKNKIKNKLKIKKLNQGKIEIKGIVN